jgi:hypothetical protein
MGGLARVMSGMRKWLLVLLIVIIAAPTAVAAAFYTSSSILGNIAATVLPPVQSVPANVYGAYEQFTDQLPITYARVNVTIYDNTTQFNSLLLELQTPKGTTLWVCLNSYSLLMYQYWTEPRGNFAPYNGPMNVIYTPLLQQYDNKPAPVVVSIGYELFAQIYSVLSSHSVINCSMDQLKVINFCTSSPRDSAKVWIDGASPTVVISTSRLYSWLGYRVAGASLDAAPVTAFDGSSVTLPAETTGSHALSVTLQSWIPIFKTTKTLQVSV